MSNPASASYRWGNSQHGNVCNNELLDMIEKLHDYISSLPVISLRKIPEFNEEIHLNLSLEAYRIKQKYRPQIKQTWPSTSTHFPISHLPPSTNQCGVQTARETIVPSSSDVDQTLLDQSTPCNFSDDTGFVELVSAYSGPTNEDITNNRAINDIIPICTTNVEDDDDIQIIEEPVAQVIEGSPTLRKKNKGFYFSIISKRKRNSHSEIALYVAKEHANQHGLIFCFDDKESINVEEALKDHDISVCRLSSISDEERWIKGEVKVLICSSKLPKPMPREKEIAFIIHGTLPISMKSFIKKLKLIPKKKKEVIDCVIFYSRLDLYKYRSLFGDSDQETMRKRHNLYFVSYYCEGSGCRKFFLSQTKCQSVYVSCDNCLDGRVNSYEIVNVSEESKEILNRLNKQHNQTITQITSKDKDQDRELTWKILSQLLLKGYLYEVASSGSRYPKVLLTQKGLDVIADLGEFQIVVERRKIQIEEDDEDDACSILDENEFNPYKKLKLEKMDNNNSNGENELKLQQSRECFNELMNLLKELYDYNSDTLSLVRLRQLPDIDEGLHLRLLLKTYCMIQKCQSQVVSLTTVTPSHIINNCNFSEARKPTESSVMIQQTNSTFIEKEVASPSASHRVHISPSPAARGNLSEDLGFVSPISMISTETVKNPDLPISWILQTTNTRKDSAQLVQNNPDTLIRRNKKVYYSVKQKNQRNSHLGIAEYVLREHWNEQGIIYCHDDTKEAAKLEEQLFKLGITVCRFSNACNEKRWTDGEVKVLLCAPNFPKSPIHQKIGFFIYASVPVSMNSLKNKLELIVPPEENGIVDFTIFYSRFDRYKFGSFFKDDNEKMKKKRQKLYDVVNFCEGSDCRKLSLTGIDCQSTEVVSCDNCFKGVNSLQMMDVTKKARSILKRLIKHGDQTVAQIAALDKKEDKEMIFKILNQLIFRGYLKEVSNSRFYPKLVPTSKGRNAIAESQGFQQNHRQSLQEVRDVFELLTSFHTLTSMLPLSWLRQIPEFDEERYLDSLLRIHRMKMTGSQQSLLQAIQSLGNHVNSAPISNFENACARKRAECQVMNASANTSTVLDAPIANSEPVSENLSDNISASNAVPSRHAPSTPTIITTSTIAVESPSTSSSQPVNSLPLDNQDDADIQIIKEHIPHPGRFRGPPQKISGISQSTNAEKRRFYYNVVMKGNQKDSCAAIAKFIKTNYPGEFGIVYCHDDDEVIDLELELRKLGVLTCSLLSNKDSVNSKNEEWWARGKVNVLCAARSPKQWMSKKLRFIFHATLPASLGKFRRRLTFVKQKQGVIDCTIFYRRNDLHWKFRHFFRHNSDEVLEQRKNLYSVAAFCEDQISCRRQVLSRLLCEKAHLSCDNCIRGGQFEWLDVSQKARMILSDLKNGYHTIRQIADRFGKNKSKANEVTLKILHALIHRGYLTEFSDKGRYPRAYRTQIVDKVLQDGSPFQIKIQWGKKSGTNEEDLDILSIFHEDQWNDSKPLKRLKLDIGYNEVSDEDVEARTEDSDFFLRLSPSNSECKST
ncbi:hypothetical protein QAD02_015438 [Eretmocerus hayati]|uniref:Uncharacterized protein n=1 Tax=Eretmocerus hayati TaxID=131215 RepID=A0ACC2P9I0_9HYME|nr:hypothetical protein QAD02_015438 [Eretmocerus hayati]